MSKDKYLSIFLTQMEANSIALSDSEVTNAVDR